MIRVLVVEDSPVVRELLSHVLSSDPAVQVIGTASNGEEALEAVGRIRPDIITMDIHMPKMNGLDAARRIMETIPTPIVVVSGSCDPEEVSTTFRALEAGALAVVRRPAGIGHENHSQSSSELIRTVKAMAEVKVVRRWAKTSRPPLVAIAPFPPETEIKPGTAEVKVVAIGASTGGPLALQAILAGLPADFDAPILVVQHIAPGFIRGFVDWLDRSTKLSVGVAQHGEMVVPGRVYFAPDGFQMQVSASGRIALAADEPENGLRPSVSYLFRSVANAYQQHAVGILLTGMGKDGAEELMLMKQKGCITIAQDEESSVVYGMPREAIRLGGVCYVLAPSRIAAALLSLVPKREMLP
jgi:two-component system, chemotaxis family, protein-glutamate methylesterase/glutaminase